MGELTALCDSSSPSGYDFQLFFRDFSVGYGHLTSSSRDFRASVATVMRFAIRIHSTSSSANRFFFTRISPSLCIRPSSFDNAVRSTFR